MYAWIWKNGKKFPCLISYSRKLCRQKNTLEFFVRFHKRKLHEGIIIFETKHVEHTDFLVEYNNFHFHLKKFNFVLHIFCCLQEGKKEIKLKCRRKTYRNEWNLFISNECIEVEILQIRKYTIHVYKTYRRHACHCEV